MYKNNNLFFRKFVESNKRVRFKRNGKEREEKVWKGKRREVSKLDGDRDNITLSKK